jgi:hypothetical protein
LQLRDSIDLRIVRILSVPIIRPLVCIHYLSHPLYVHHLPHRLSSGNDGDHIVSGLDEIPGPRAAESTAASSSPSPSTSLTDLSFGGTQVDFARRSSLPATTAASNASARWHACA